MTELLRRAVLSGERGAASRTAGASRPTRSGHGGHVGRREVPIDTAGFLLWRTTLRWQRAIATALRPLGLTHVQYALLSAVRNLTRDGVRPNQRQVADHAGTDVMMTSQVLRTLESRGLVTRVADATDARAKRLVVTGDGVRLAENAASVVQDADRAFFAEVRDRAQLLEALRLLAGR